MAEGKAPGSPRAGSHHRSLGHCRGVVRAPWASSVATRDLLGSSMWMTGSAARREQLASLRRRAGAWRLRVGSCLLLWQEAIGEWGVKRGAGRGAPPVWRVLGVLGSGADPSNPRYWESWRGYYSDAGPKLLGRSFLPWIFLDWFLLPVPSSVGNRWGWEGCSSKGLLEFIQGLRP